MSPKQNCIFFSVVVFDKITLYLGEEVFQFLDVFDCGQLPFIAEHHSSECLGKPILLLKFFLLRMQRVTFLDRLLLI